MSKKPRDLVLVERAKKQLAEATSVNEVVDIRDKAEALRIYTKQQNESFEAQNAAAEIKVRAERRAGELLAELPRSGGPGRGKKNQQDVDSFLSTIEREGIQHQTAQRWQAEAIIPEKQFEKHLAETKAEGREITSSELVRIGGRIKRRKKKAKELKAKASVELDKPTECEVICGDCCKELKKLSDVRLIFADPPYNIGVDYGSGHTDKLTPKRYLNWCRRWMTQAVNSLSPDGSMWVMINDEWAAQYAALLDELGLHRRAWIKWYETFGVNCSNNFNRTSRHIFYYVADQKNFVFDPAPVSCESQRQTTYKDRRADHHGKLWDDVWFVSRVTGTSKERVPDFPTQVPEAITDAIVQCASQAGDFVVDPFNGSGTTGVSCRRFGRRYLGIERNQDYVDRANTRIVGTIPKNSSS